jgi:arylsulfatase A-like enzyme
MAKPNFIFILMDDFGWTDLGCYGSSFYQTPNIDRLCTEGMRFTDAYASCPVCSPTRASVLTGKYPATVGITDWIDSGGHLHPARGRLIDVPYLKDLPTSEHSLAKALNEGGYQTWHVGKWHLGGPGHLPEDHGFEINIGGCHAGSPGGGGYFSPWSIPALQDADVPDGAYLPDYLTDRTIELIENRDDRPFFLHFPFYLVHTPIQAKEEKILKYKARARELGLNQDEALEECELFPCEHKKTQHVMRRRFQSDPVYAGMVESMDENIGRLLQTLEEQGLIQDTAIFFTSDNGGLVTSEGSPTCNAPLSEGKGWMYEGGTREPLIVRFPGGVAPDTVCTTPVTTPDFYPTLLAMAGLDPIPQQHCDGINILPLLEGDQELDREAIFWHYPHYGNQGGTPGSSVRAGDYKLIEFFEDNRLELYNLREDIEENHNLAAELPDVRDRLHDMLVAWRQSIEAKIPQPNPDFEPWQ